MGLPSKPWLNIAPAVRANCEASGFVKVLAAYGACRFLCDVLRTPISSF
jgi:hypothetical protein